MGVKGWNKILQDENWARSHAPCCSTQIWRTDADWTAAPAPPYNNAAGNGVPLAAAATAAAATATAEVIGLRTLTAGATLHVDGNGLAFWILKIAYARHMEAVVVGGSSSSNGNNDSRSHHHHHPSSTTRPCRTKVTNLSASQIRRLLPTFMPLALLTDVTNEFMSLLQQRGLHIVVYWDGLRRRIYKQATDEKRQARRTVEWSALQQYCQHGVLPIVTSSSSFSTNKRKPSMCQWLDSFPISRLFVSQIRHALQGLQIRNLDCEEEADPVLARAVAGKSDAYILGLDSDFCFFRNVQYIPLGTIDASTHIVTASVWKRCELAESLDLADAHMVELALLLGNDYCCLSVPGMAPGASAEACIEHLQSQPTDYVVPTTHDTHESARFVRALYNLDDMSEFPLDDAVDESMLLIGNDEDEVDDIDDLVAPTVRPGVPAQINLTLAMTRSTDSSVKAGVLRCLQAYVDECSGDQPSMLSQHQLDIFANMSLLNSSNNNNVAEILDAAPWRPQWDDVLAAYLIEKMFVFSLQNSPASLVTRLYAPSNLFDSYVFHALLHTARENNLTNAGEPVEEAMPLTGQEAVPEERPLLPIDEHEEKILGAIEKNRVTIIQGETGCGKSSRIPIMILKARPPSLQLNEVRLFMSQPHRIAAKALVERVRSVEPDFGDKVALRMGHGVREYETAKTRAWFVTTGYLVRRLANQPDLFDNISHLIIDEVHERGVDTDVLCLLCRRLLKRNPHIRLVLMSATLAAALYQEYFGVPEAPIFVGARRFPVKEVFLEDMHKLNIGQREEKNVSALIAECNKLKCKPPSTSYMEKLYSVVTRLAVVVGKPGSSVLIFVTGMNDIVAITELVEKTYVSGVRFTCFPIHSDIPFEDQMNVFEPSARDEVKVIIATNAAESSVTLPDVDSVICLGLCKQIVYNAISHRQMLTPTWISRSSATQRAGRTGRLRPGTVYRMYTNEIFRNSMEEFEPGEMVRVPLDSVILMLKQMLKDENVTEVLLECLEPPELSTIDRSFESLHRWNFISSPDEFSDITNLGAFVLALGVDLSLGSVVGLGIQCGVGAEALQIAGVLSFPKTPWIIANPLIHDTRDYNKITVKSFESRLHFDTGLFSEPLAALNLLWDYEKTKQKARWCSDNAVSYARIKRLSGSVTNLRQRVAKHVGIPSSALEPDCAPREMPPGKIAILRIIHVWVFYDSLIECRPQEFFRGLSGQALTVELRQQSALVVKKDLRQILSTRHVFELERYVEIEQKGKFEIGKGNEYSLSSEAAGLEQRFLSYSTQNNFTMVWLYDHSVLVVYIKKAVLDADDFVEIRAKLEERLPIVDNLAGSMKTKGRGLAERDCGIWSFECSDRVGEDAVAFTKFCTTENACSGSKMKSLDFHLADYLRSHPSINGISCNLHSGKKKQSAIQFHIKLRGHCDPIPNLTDLFGIPNVTCSTKKICDKQAVSFPIEMAVCELPNCDTDREQGKARNIPLLSVIPEGARILSVIASGRRKDHVIRLLPQSEYSNGNGNAEETIDIYPEPAQTAIGKRWKRFNSESTVYVSENSVPSSAIPLNGSDALYCCCANILEVRGGGIRVEGLTMLPTGRLFLQLAKLSFGLENEHVESDDGLEMMCRWLADYNDDWRRDYESSRDEWKDRIRAALTFYAGTKDLGDDLVCSPDTVFELLALFSGVSEVLEVWDNFDTDPFNPANLKRLRRTNTIYQRQAPPSETKPGFAPSVGNVVRLRLDGTSGGSPVSPDSVPGEMELTTALESLMRTINAGRPGTRGMAKDTASKYEFDYLDANARIDTEVTEETRRLAHRLFSGDLNPGESVKENEFPAANIMSLVLQEFAARSHLHEGVRKALMSIDGPAFDWTIRRVLVDGDVLWQALFYNPHIPLIPRGRKRFIPGWIRAGSTEISRPPSIDDARACIPHGFLTSGDMHVIDVDGINSIFFGSADIAFRMEAAFWLERQFGNKKRHWFQRSIPEMVHALCIASAEG